MFDRLIRWILGAWNPGKTSTLRNPASWLIDGFGWKESDSGVRIDGRSILSYAPMWYAVNRISGHVGILPCHLMQAIAGGDIRKAEPWEFPEVRVVNRKPNEYMSASDMRETVQSHAIVHGNGRCAITRNGLGQAVELLPITPETTVTYLLYQEGGLVEKWHLYTSPDGQQIPIPDRDCLHVKGLAGDGLVGYSLVSIARESLGGALAAERYVNRSYKNGGMPSIILEAPEQAFRDDKHAEDFLKLFHSHHGGLDNVNKPGLLRYGVTARQISQSNTDAQFLENRRFSREEAALWTAIESMLGVEKGESYNSLMQRNEAYRQNCLARWLTKWEQELDLKLLSDRQRAAGYFWKFDTYRLLSGSIRERWETLAIGRQMGLVSQEESRRMEHLGAMNPNENFDNPNTTPGGPAADRNGRPEQTTEGRVESALRAQLAHEGQGLLMAAESPDGFLDRVDRYYRRLRGHIRGRFAEVGASTYLADQWISDSQAHILRLTERVTPAGLAGEVEKELATWSAKRIEPFVARIVHDVKRNLLVR